MVGLAVPPVTSILAELEGAVSEVILTVPLTTSENCPETSVLITVAIYRAVADPMDTKSPVLKVAVTAPPPSTETVRVCPSDRINVSSSEEIST